MAVIGSVEKPEFLRFRCFEELPIDLQGLGKPLAHALAEVGQSPIAAAIQQDAVTACKRDAQGRYRKTLGGGGAADGEPAVHLIDAEGDARDLVVAGSEYDISVQALAAQGHLPGVAVDFDGSALGNQKERDPEQDQIHHRKIPERSRGSDETAHAQRFDDRHRNKQQQ